MKSLTQKSSTVIVGISTTGTGAGASTTGIGAGNSITGVGAGISKTEASAASTGAGAGTLLAHRAAKPPLASPSCGVRSSARGARCCCCCPSASTSDRFSSATAAASAGAHCGRHEGGGAADGLHHGCQSGLVHLCSTRPDGGQKAVCKRPKHSCLSSLES